MATLSPPDRRTLLLTEREVADILRVSGRTVRRWAFAGTLSAIEIGGVRRYRADDIAALIDPSTRTGHAGNVTGSKLAGAGDGHDRE